MTYENSSESYLSSMHMPKNLFYTSCVLFTFLGYNTLCSAQSCSFDILILINKGLPYSAELKYATGVAQAVLQNLSLSCNVNIEIQDSMGQVNQTVGILLSKKNFSAIIGIDSGCPECCLQAAAFAKAQTSLAKDPQLTNQFIRPAIFVSHGCRSIIDYPNTYATMMPSIQDSVMALCVVLKKYQWHRVAILLSQVSLNADERYVFVQTINSNWLLNVQVVSITSIPILLQPGSNTMLIDNYNALRTFVRSIQYDTRIIVIMSNDIEFTVVTLAACQEAMTSGYVFIGWNLPAKSSYQPPFTCANGNEIAYRHGSIIINNYDSTSQFKEFETNMEMIKAYSQGTQQSSNISVPYEAALMFTALRFWGEVQKNFNTKTQQYDFNNVVVAQFTGFASIKYASTDVSTFVGTRLPWFDLNIINDGRFIQVTKIKEDREDPTDSLLQKEAFTWQKHETVQPTDLPENFFSKYQDILIVSGVVSFICIMLIVFIIIVVCNKIRSDKELFDITLWKVAAHEIEFPTDNKSKITRILSPQSSTNFSSNALPDAASESEYRPKERIYGKCRGKQVHFAPIQLLVVDITQKSILIEITNVRSLCHENINSLIGACVDPELRLILWHYHQKGSLQDFLAMENRWLVPQFGIGMALDIANGMSYLHESVIGSHGHLTSRNVLVTSRWSCVITDYGFPRLRGFRSRMQKYSKHNPESMLWTAPELLRTHPAEWPLCGTPQADVYAYGIILSEIVTKEAPYKTNLEREKITISKILDKVEKCVSNNSRNNDNNSKTQSPYRPQIPPAKCNDINWLKLITRCWSEDITKRPNFEAVKGLLRVINGNKKIDVIDIILKMLRDSEAHLNKLVNDREGELKLQKTKIDNLLYTILPKSIAAGLKQGKEVKPEYYDSVSLYQSDIVGFTAISAGSTALQVVSMLSNLYIIFDGIIQKFDAFKVETIGDAYIVVSGCPDRNGDQHAIAIADLGLTLLSEIIKFKIPHMPSKNILLRIGLHSGGLCAGIVGTLVPRYCLFGDTMRIVGTMESTGSPNLVHISEEIAGILRKENVYNIKERGKLTMKNKEKLKTHWLLGKTGLNLSLPEMTIDGDLIGDFSEKH